MGRKTKVKKKENNHEWDSNWSGDAMRCDAMIHLMPLCWHRIGIVWYDNMHSGFRKQETIEQKTDPSLIHTHINIYQREESKARKMAIISGTHCLQ